MQLSKLHVTDLTSYRACKRYFYFNTILNREVPLREPIPALEIGSYGHALLQFYFDPEVYNKISAGNRLDHYDTERGHYVSLCMGQSIELKPESFEAADTYARSYVANVDIHNQWEVIGTEMEIEVPIGDTGCSLIATFDLVVRLPDGRIRAIDHKFYSSIPDHQSLEWDPQMSAYDWVLHQGFPGERIAGVVMNVIRKANPQKPRLIQSGKRLSVDKTQDTTFVLFQEAIQDHGFEEVDYADMLDYLRANEQPAFKQFSIHRGRVRRDLFFQDLVEEITLYKQNRRWTPSPGTQCGSCEFLQVCRSMSDGGNWEDILESRSQERQIRIPLRRNMI